MYWPDINQKIIRIVIDYKIVVWMCIYVQTEWHYWLSHDMKCPSMNIEEHHPLSLELTHDSRPSRVYEWANYRVSWMCSCFHCCWICMTFINFGVFRSYSFTYTFQTCTIINEQVPQLGWHFIIHSLVHQSYIVIGEEKTTRFFVNTPMMWGGRLLSLHNTFSGIPNKPLNSS